MKYYLMLFILITGCDTIGTKNVSCNDTSRSFIEYYQCKKVSYDNDSDAKNSESYKLYMLKGEQLAQQVGKGEMSDIDAKVEWQETLLKVREIQGAARARAVDMYNATRPKTATCRKYGNTTNCTSQ